MDSHEITVFRRRMQALGLSEKKLAGMLGLSQQYVNDVMRQRRQGGPQREAFDRVLTELERQPRPEPLPRPGLRTYSRLQDELHALSQQIEESRWAQAAERTSTMPPVESGPSDPAVPGTSDKPLVPRIKRL